MANLGLSTDYAVQTQFTVGTTSVNVVEPTPRSMLYYRNSSTGTQLITISHNPNQAAASLSGIVLKPGDMYVEANSEGFSCYQGAVRAIADQAGGVLSVMVR